MRIDIFLIAGIIVSTAKLGQAQSEPIVIEKLYQREIKQLAGKKKIREAFKLIEELEDMTQATHIELTEIEAPPFEEDTRAVAFKTFLARAGVDSVWIDEVGNVIGLLKGSIGKRTVALDAHLDTVFPRGTDVKVKMRGDTLFAPGIGDDTRGLSMVHTVAKAMIRGHIRTRDNLLFIATVGEEGLGDLRGVKHLFGDQGPSISSWISIDGGRIGRVNTKGLGSYRYRVSIAGPGGHSWGAFGLANPHHALGRAIDLFVEQADKFTNSGPRTSYNIGRIGGGTSINSIPFESWMEVDVRSEQPARLDSMEVLLKSAVQSAVKYQNDIKRLGKDLDFKIEKIGNRPSGELPNSLPLVQRALGATAFMGTAPKLTRGSTNANTPISLGIPAVRIGRGGVGANGHSLDEWWINREGYKAIQLALLLVVAEAGLE